MRGKCVREISVVFSPSVGLWGLLSYLSCHHFKSSVGLGSYCVVLLRNGCLYGFIHVSSVTVCWLMRAGPQNNKLAAATDPAK